MLCIVLVAVFVLLAVHKCNCVWFVVVVLHLSWLLKFWLFVSGSGLFVSCFVCIAAQLCVGVRVVSVLQLLVCLLQCCLLCVCPPGWFALVPGVP